MGRHSTAEPDEDETELSVELPAEVPERVLPARRPMPSGARGDLQLLRRDPALRLRCAGAVALAFLVYSSVLVLIGRSDVYLIWVWIPTVVSGVAVGGLLDSAHGAQHGPVRGAPVQQEDGPPS